MIHHDQKNEKKSCQMTTFFIGKDLFGIDVMQVQEVTRKLPLTKVPLAPTFVPGLINLRGQISTAIELSELFSIQSTENQGENAVVCRIDGSLISLLVDSIGDVIEVYEHQFEKTPDTVQPEIKRFLSGIYKVDGALLSVIDLNKMNIELENFINKKVS